LSGVAGEAEGGPASTRSNRNRGCRKEYELERERERERERVPETGSVDGHWPGEIERERVRVRES
jgi:hypothetical protein